MGWVVNEGRAIETRLLREFDREEGVFPSALADTKTKVMLIFTEICFCQKYDLAV